VNDHRDEPLRARIPADVDRPDTIMFGLTLRQLVILAVTGLTLYAAWTAVATVVNPLIFLAACAPVAGLAFLLAVGRRDGITLDRWVMAGLRHRRSPHHLVPADAPISAAPAWVATTRGAGSALPVPAPLRLPAKGITEGGLIDLGPDGTTGVLSASTVAFGLRAPGEQNALVGAFARWLHSLTGPTQILIRTRPIHLGHLADTIRASAPGLPHPALEQAAWAHAAFLERLGTERDLLHRQVSIAVRGTRSPLHTMQRTSDAVRAIAGCEVTATALDGWDAQELLADCLNPAGHTRPAPATFPAETDGGEAV
jgi:hypothetical protein